MFMKLIVLSLINLQVFGHFTSAKAENIFSNIWRNNNKKQLMEALEILSDEIKEDAKADNRTRPENETRPDNRTEPRPDNRTRLDDRKRPDNKTVPKPYNRTRPDNRTDPRPDNRTRPENRTESEPE